MGWRGTVRSINAAAKRAAREEEKAQRAYLREHSRIDRSEDAVIKKAVAFEARLERDPLKALNLRYDRRHGFTADSFRIETELFSGHIALITHEDDAKVQFNPDIYRTVDSSVAILDVMLCRWGTFVAFEVSNENAEYSLRTSWVKKSDRQSSLILLLDTNTSTYYYPISTSLSGEVVAGHPKIGIICFEPMRTLTDRIAVHLSNVQLQKGRGGKHTVKFEHTSNQMRRLTDSAIKAEPLKTQVRELLAKESSRLRQAVRKPTSGCLLALCAILAGCGLVFAFGLTIAIARQMSFPVTPS
ncbi:MAG: hypothetical protein AAF586_01840 [Planctomycetota bacterium]